MARRNISDEEIGLIKAMLEKGYKNKDIQFYFNRPDRSVNSGRITGIRKGTYSNSASIPVANDRALSRFLKTNKSLIDPTATSQNPLATDLLKKRFKRISKVGWTLTDGECDQSECKAGFGLKHPGAWVRAIGALANNRGGYIFLGLSEKQVGTRRNQRKEFVVTGINPSTFPSADPEKISTILKNTYDPTPSVQLKSLKIGQKTIGVIHVEKCSEGPIIASRSCDSDVREGDIFFRYPGQSTRIKHSELRQLIDNRIRSARKQVLPFLEKIIDVGPEKAMIADLSDGELSDGTRSIFIDEDLLKKVEFIKSGEFNEEDGAPTLKLVGDVRTATGASIVQRTALTTADIIADFLEGAVRGDPEEYVRAALEGGQILWLPVHYFVHHAGLSEDEACDLIDSTHASSARKLRFKNYIRGRISAYHKPSTTPLRVKGEIADKTVPDLISSERPSSIGYAVSGIKTEDEFDLEKLRRLLKSTLSEVEASGASNDLSALRRAVCRVDELWQHE